MKNIKEKRLWLLWQKKERNGKTAKVPFAANGGKSGTSEEHRPTWVAASILGNISSGQSA